MTTKAWTPQTARVDVSAKTIAWFGFLCLLYVTYVWSFYATDGFSSIRDLSRWRVVQKIALIAFPLGISYLWTQRRSLIALDFHLAYASVVAWGLAFYFAGRNKGLSNAYVEILIVGLLSELYLLRFTLRSLFPAASPARIAMGLFALVLFASFLVPFVIPVLPD